MRTPLLMVGLMFLSLTACTKEDSGKAAQDKAPPAATPPAQKAPAETPPPPTAAPPAVPADATGWQKAAYEGKPLFATLQTNQGTVVVSLFSKDAPKTVANFVGLASGEKQWMDPRTRQSTTKPLYDGTVFHRVIPGFMIQGGDPLGSGMGDPGYRFQDEFQSGRSFNKPGILAMANAGPNTNGSQFFITVAPTPHLDNRHTIFGEVVKGYDVVEKIAGVPRDPRDRPLQPVTLEKVTISEKAP
ncbi:peptidylprolyl isomerase [Myxococcaceae bacterium GXIMD 01537]